MLSWFFFLSSAASFNHYLADNGGLDATHPYRKKWTDLDIYTATATVALYEMRYVKNKQDLIFQTNILI